MAVCLVSMSLFDESCFRLWFTFASCLCPFRARIMTMMWAMWRMNHLWRAFTIHRWKERRGVCVQKEEARNTWVWLWKSKKGFLMRQLLIWCLKRLPWHWRGVDVYKGQVLFSRVLLRVLRWWVWGAVAVDLGLFCWLRTWDRCRLTTTGLVLDHQGNTSLCPPQLLMAFIYDILRVSSRHTCVMS